MPCEMTLSKETAARNKKVDEDIERLKEWLLKQPHLPHDFDEVLLRAYVNGTKSLEIAKQKLDSWFAARNKIPQLFSYDVRNPFSKDFVEGCKAVNIFFLPKATPEGHRVLWIREGEDFSKFSHAQKIVRCLMTIELAMIKWPEMPGLVVVYDLDQLPANIITKLSVSLSAAALHWFQNTIPLKLKKGLIVNSPGTIELIMNTVAKPFIKEKMYNRLIVTHEGTKLLKKHLPEDILPEDYGGKEKHSSLINEDWMNLIKEKADWFKLTSSLRSDEKKRPADKACTYGVEGTFRTLAID